MRDIHLTKKDFKLEWYSGSGAGGQHRNKHQNCCRITHIETGVMAIGADSRSRVTNQRIAFTRLANKIVSYYKAIDDHSDRRTSGEVIRNYNEPRNEVHDKASGFKQPYKSVILNSLAEDMINARRAAVAKEMFEVEDG